MQRTRNTIGGASVSPSLLDVRSVTQIQSARSDTSINTSVADPLHTISPIDAAVTTESVPAPSVNVMNYGARPLFTTPSNTSETPLYIAQSDILQVKNWFVGSDVFPLYVASAPDSTVVVATEDAAHALQVTNLGGELLDVAVSGTVAVVNATDDAIRVTNTGGDAMLVTNTGGDALTVVSTDTAPVQVANTHVNALYVQPGDTALNVVSSNENPVVVFNQGIAPLWVQNTETNALTVVQLPTQFAALNFTDIEYTATPTSTMGAVLSFAPTSLNVTIQSIKAIVFLDNALITPVPHFYQIRVYANNTGYPINDQFQMSYSFMPTAQGQSIMLSDTPITVTGANIWFLLFRDEGANFVGASPDPVPFGQSMSNEYTVFLEIQYTTDLIH